MAAETEEIRGIGHSVRRDEEHRIQRGAVNKKQHNHLHRLQSNP
jgi:hypothetical protein